MFPVLFTIFGYQITSFGIFLIVSILLSLFIMWRMSHIFELDQEKILDLFFVTTIVSFFGARIWYILEHLPQFNNVSKMLLIFKNPGLSFWGALLFGAIIIRFLSPKLRLNYWQIADISIIAAFFASSILSFGCLFSVCQYGHVYDGLFAVTQYGLSGTRFPLQLIEAGLFLLGFIYLWNAILRFHFNGKIVSLGFIILGVMKLILEPLRADGSPKLGFTNLSVVMSLLSVSLGIFFFYLQSKRSFRGDLKFLISLPFSRHKQKLVVSKWRRVWYNFFVASQVSYQKWQKDLRKQLRVKSTPSKF